MFVISFTSCTKDDGNGIKSSNGSIKSVDYNPAVGIIDGRLFFSDTAQLVEHLEWIYSHMNDEEVIENYYNSIGFTTLAQKYNQVMFSENVDTLNYALINYSHCFKEEIVDNETFYDISLPFGASYISNVKGIYQVGNNIVRVTPSYKVIIVNGDSGLIPYLFNDTATLKTNPNFKIINNERSSHYPCKYLNYSYRTSYFNNRNRIVTKMYWSEAPLNLGFMYDVKNSSQTKVCGIWWQKRISTIGIKNYQGHYKSVNSPNIYNIPPSTLVLNNKAVVYKGPLSISPIDFLSSSCLYDCWGVKDGVRREILNQEQFPDSW